MKIIDAKTNEELQIGDFIKCKFDLELPFAKINEVHVKITEENLSKLQENGFIILEPDQDDIIAEMINNEKVYYENVANIAKTLSEIKDAFKKYLECTKHVEEKKPTKK